MWPATQEVINLADILILGGSGIISKEVTSLAISLGHNVTIVNRGKRNQFIHQDAKLIIADLRNDSVLAIKSKITKSYDAIIDVISYNKIELERNLSIAKGKCKQYFFFSTSVVYKTKQGRYSEDDEIGNLDWDYSIKKIECEELLKEKANEYGFNWTVVRPYITYGETRIPLQFGPIEYYTIINRAKAGKLIPVFEREAKCTLTYSKDFAVGVVGLIGNPEAFNQTFHITGSYETTWNRALDKIMDAFNTSYTVIKLSESQFRDTYLMRGLDASEVYGDKGRDMLFVNDKIKRAVPEFIGNTSFSNVLPDIVQFFSNKQNQKINYAWDARVDCMLSKSGLLTRKQKKMLRFAPGAATSSHDKWIYFWNRYELTYFLMRVCKKIKHMVIK